MISGVADSTFSLTMAPGDDHVDNSSDEELSPPPPDENDFAAHHQNSISVIPSTIQAEPHPPEKIRKKPGRKPGWNKPKDGESANASTNGEGSTPNPDAPKKRVRKPKDPNAPVVPRSRKKKTESLDTNAALAIAQPRQDLQPRPPTAEIVKSQTPDLGKNEAIHRYVLAHLLYTVALKCNTALFSLGLLCDR